MATIGVTIQALPGDREHLSMLVIFVRPPVSFVKSVVIQLCFLAVLLSFYQKKYFIDPMHIISKNRRQRVFATSWECLCLREDRTPH
jgi:hypothetical protein